MLAEWGLPPSLQKEWGGVCRCCGQAAAAVQQRRCSLQAHVQVGGWRGVGEQNSGYYCRCVRGAEDDPLCTGRGRSRCSFSLLCVSCVCGSDAGVIQSLSVICMPNRGLHICVCVCARARPWCARVPRASARGERIQTPIHHQFIYLCTQHIIEGGARGGVCSAD